MELFRGNYHRSQRRPKRRGGLRRAKRLVNNPSAFQQELRPEDWFNLWHLHLDCTGLGDRGPALRHIFLEGYAKLFRHLALQAHLLGKPYQLWILLDQNDADQDAVYLHTPNQHTPFPVDFKHVQWRLRELEEIFAPWLPEFSLVAGRAGPGLFVYAEGYGVPLRQPGPPVAT